MSTHWLIGVDEVGRGALAGPLVVAAFAAPVMHLFEEDSFFVDLRDSKRLQASRREKVDAALRSDPRVLCVTASVSHTVIDRVGISAAGTLAVQRLLRRLVHHSLFPISSSLVLLDGGLTAPAAYRQMTIIRGDAQLAPIAAASILAKLHRDRFMHRQHQRFPQYGFDQNVGYGTRTHYAALRRHGPSPLHRRSFRLSREHPACYPVSRSLPAYTRRCWIGNESASRGQESRRVPRISSIR